MSRTTNARIAGVTFLVYIAAGIASLLLKGHAHATDLLSIVTSFSALVLGVTLFSITRVVDPDLALLAFGCRLIEAIPHNQGGAIYFAVGSTLFAWLLLRGRMIPIALGWLGVIASALMAILLPLQRAGLFTAGSSWSSKITWLLWLPMLVYEVVLAILFLTKGVARE